MTRARILVYTAIGAVVVLLIAGAGILVGMRLGDTTSAEQPPAEPPSTPTAPTSSPPQDAAGDPRYEVEAGSGGTDVAEADGETPVGYDSGCPGAVQAATNYVTYALSGNVQWRVDQATYEDLIDELNNGLDGGIGPMSDRKARVIENGFFTDTTSPFYFETHPEWGIYRVTDCYPGNTATIDVIYATADNATPEIAGVPGLRVYLTWNGGDWRLVDAESDFMYPLRENHPDLPPDAQMGATREWREQALSTLGPDWQEYTNAPAD